jgi:putative ABC transport system substrate-binding protein
MKRRHLAAFLGGAALGPLPAWAQQPMPVIGFLNPVSPDAYSDLLRGFRQGLKEVGYVEGENVAIEYRWAHNQLGSLPALATDLVRRRVAVIATGGGPAAARAAKAATATIPVVFVTAEDPVRLGLVGSFARPEGNLTGINFLNTEVTAKRLEFLRKLLPAATRLAVLVNPTGASAQTTAKDVEAASGAMGLQVTIVRASTSQEIDAAFAVLARERPDFLFVSPDPFFRSRHIQVTHLATRHAIPATYALRDYAEVGGLMSYGTSLTDAFRQSGVYVGRILKGAKPSDLPVLQASKFELVINAQAARTLGLAVPPALLAVADEVIE